MVNVGGVSGEYLRSYIERIERLEEEKGDIAQNIKEVFAEAKGNGFDTKTMREILKIRKMDASDAEEQDYLLDTYKKALGMTPLTPLEEYIEKKKEDSGEKPEQPDPLYQKAVELVREENKATTSFVQRHLKIGYNRAANLIDEMEKNLVITAANFAGVRTIKKEG
jgi:uncharacterized protein (UPF0335 family)